MDHVGVVVDDLEAATAFFAELGMELEGAVPVEGRWADRVSGLDGIEVAQYEDSCRLCYVRGPAGIIVALAEQLSGRGASRFPRVRRGGPG